MPEHADARLEIALPLLGRVVLGVLAQVAQLARALDLLGQFDLQLALERLDLVFEPFDQVCLHRPLQRPQSSTRLHLVSCRARHLRRAAVPAPMRCQTAVKRIASRQNPLVRLRPGSGPRGRGRRARPIVLDGAHLVGEALCGRSSRARIAVSTSSPRARRGRRLVRAASARPAPRSSPRHARHPRGDEPDTDAVRRRGRRRAPPPGRSPAALDRRPALVLAAVDVQDPGNVGAIVRAADAAGASAVVFCGASADPFGWKALRGSMGSAFRVPLVRRVAVRGPDRRVPPARHPHLGRDPARWHGPVRGRSRGPTCCLLLGGEGGGLGPDVCHARRRVPDDSDAAGCRVTQRRRGRGTGRVRSVPPAGARSPAGARGRRGRATGRGGRHGRT